MGLKDKVQDTSGSIKDQLEYMKKDSKYLKKFIQSKKVVQIKTEATAILVRKKGNEDEFFKEFDKITKDGYKMMLSEEVTDPVPGIKVNVGFIYFFQHKKFID
ncbi:MAG: hypothetical protein ACO2Y5_05225 [Nitrosopumilaceae archaeon]